MQLLSIPLFLILEVDEIKMPSNHISLKVNCSEVQPVLKKHMYCKEDKNVIGFISIVGTRKIGYFSFKRDVFNLNQIF